MADPVYRVGPCHVFIGNPNISDGAGMTFLGFTRDDVEVTPTVNISSGRVDQIGTSGLADAVWFGGMDPTVSIPLVDEDKNKLLEYMFQSSYIARVPTPASDIGALTRIGNTANATTAFVNNSITPLPEIRNGDYILAVTTAGGANASRFSLTNPDGKLIETGIRIGGGSNAGARRNDEILFKISQTGQSVANTSYRFTVQDVEGPSVGFGSGFTKFDDLGTLAVIPSDQLSSGTNGIDAADALWIPSCVAHDVGSWMYSLPDNNNDSMSRRSTQFRGLRRRLDTRTTTLGGNDRSGAGANVLPASHRIAFIGPPSSMDAVTEGGVTYAAPSWSLPAAPTG